MRILLVQTSFLGDTVLSTPVIAALKELNPTAELWMMTTPAAAALVRRDPLLAGIIPFAKRREERGPGGLLRLAGRLREMRFSQAYALHRSARTALLLAAARIPRRIGFTSAKLSFFYHETRPRPQALHDVWRNLALLAPEIGPPQELSPPPKLRLFPPREEELPSELRARLPAAGSYALLTPGSAWETKRWSTTGFRTVAKYLLERKIPVILNGGPEEAEICKAVGKGLPVLNLAGTTSLDSALWLSQNARIVVCNDSLTLHLASAFKVPCIALFCATVPAFGFGPWRNPRAVVVAREDLSCRPCARHGGRRCPRDTWECSTGLPAERVITALKALLAK
jgi:heptosyltransferase-2